MYEYRNIFWWVSNFNLVNRKSCSQLCRLTLRLWLQLSLDIRSTLTTASIFLAHNTCELVILWWIMTFAVNSCVLKATLSSMLKAPPPTCQYWLPPQSHASSTYRLHRSARWWRLTEGLHRCMCKRAPRSGTASTCQDSSVCTSVLTWTAWPNMHPDCCCLALWCTAHGSRKCHHFACLTLEGAIPPLSCGSWGPGQWRSEEGRWALAGWGRVENLTTSELKDSSHM